MQKPDQVMEDYDQRFAAGRGVAVGDLDGDVFVGAEDHLRVVLAVIDHGIMQPAKTGARVQGHEREIILPHQIDNDVRIPAGLGGHHRCALFGFDVRRSVCHPDFSFINCVQVLECLDN
ncbi:MAG: hypothetical protein VB959_22460 [Rhodospirillales bacterium]